MTPENNGYHNITDVWNISQNDLLKIHENLIESENNLMIKNHGNYFDYQLIDDLFSDYSDKEKAMIFLYGQWVHDQFYKNSL